MKTEYFKRGEEAAAWEGRVGAEMFGNPSAGLKFRGVNQARQAGGADLEFLPDKTKGYVKFSLAHALPVLCERGCFHAGTVSNSWRSMLDQGLNYDHRVKSYHESGSNIEDRYIGGIVAVDYPREPHGGWKLTTYEESPGITCVASVFKAAQGVGKIMGEYQTGRHDWTVSLELNHDINEAGVVIYGREEEFKALTAGERKLIEGESPADFMAAGFGYVPLAKAPEEFIDCWDMESRRFSKKWKGRNLHMMFGGLNGQVHFKGTGVVRYGAEPTARIESFLASRGMTQEGGEGAEGGDNREMEKVVEAVRGALGAIGNFKLEI